MWERHWAVHPVGVVGNLVLFSYWNPDQHKAARFQDAPCPGHGYPVSPWIEGVPVAAKARVLHRAEGHCTVKLTQAAFKVCSGKVWWCVRRQLKNKNCNRKWKKWLQICSHFRMLSFDGPVLQGDHLRSV